MSPDSKSSWTEFRFCCLLLCELGPVSRLLGGRLVPVFCLYFRLIIIPNLVISVIEATTWFIALRLLPVCILVLVIIVWAVISVSTFPVC